MADVTVKQLAETVGRSVDVLLAQMRDAGLSHTTADAAVSDIEKQQLLSHLKREHGEAAGQPQKITLQRKTVSTLKTAPAIGGKAKTVNVEVRKTKTYVKRSLLEGPRATPLLWDEPFDGVDVLHRREIAAALEGRTLVFSTHSAAEARRLADALLIRTESGWSGPLPPDDERARAYLEAMEF